MNPIGSLKNRLKRFWIFIRLVRIRILTGKKLVVIYRGIGIGDIVCTFPLVAEIRKQHLGHQIVYVTSRDSRDFVARFSGADVAIGTSYVLYAQPLPKLPSWVATRSHFPRYQGEGTELAGVRTGFVLEMASSFGITLSQPRPVIAVDKKSAAESLRKLGADKALRPFIGIHLGPSMPVKEFPFSSWQELVPRLQKELGATIFRFGAKVYHSPEGSKTFQALDVEFDLTDRLNLIESTEMLSAMDLFIGIDSGLLHIANAVNIPAIGLFGPTDPAIILAQTAGVGLFFRELPCIFCQSRGLNLHWQTGCPFDIQCMKLISVDSILSQAASSLAVAGLSLNKAT